MGTCFYRQRGMTVVETLLTLFVMSVLAVVLISRYERLTSEAQEAALRTGLVNIRQSIELFKMLNNRNPEDINELLENEVMLPARIGKEGPTGSIFVHKYLMLQATDAKGNIIDPFGNPFSYDAWRGEVKSTTKGYEAW